MRTEAEVINNVLEIAEKDMDVSAVIRTDLLPVRDYLYSYNFYFITTNIEKYEDNSLYKTNLGERILLFRSDRNYPEILNDAKAHLMVFKDGVTIVIKAITLDMFWERYNFSEKGNTFQKLMDKDHILPEINNCDDSKFIFTARPTKEEFDGTCMEYYWVLKTFSEYLLRKELPAAMFYLNISVRDMLNKMMRWNIGIDHKFAVTCGILDSYFEKYLDKDLFALYLKTYPIADFKCIWGAFDAVVELFRIVGYKVAAYFGFEYPDKTEQDTLEFIRSMKDCIKV